MPNHVMNRINFFVMEEKDFNILESLLQEDHPGALDFNKIIPMPEELKIVCGSITDQGLKAYTSYKEAVKDDDPTTEALFRKEHPDVSDEAWKVGKQAYENIQKYGAPTWYEWCVQNWGTKWNSYDAGDTVRLEDKCTLSFSTAWSAPQPILKKLSEKMSNVTIFHQWADEDIGHNCGGILWKNGEVLETYLPEYGKESVEYAASMWNKTPTDFHLRLNKNGTDYEFYDEDILDEFEPDAFDPQEQSGDEQSPKM